MTPIENDPTTPAPHETGGEADASSTVSRETTPEAGVVAGSGAHASTVSRETPGNPVADDAAAVPSDDVSRETPQLGELELEPAIAATLFGDTIDRARQFAAGLAAQGEERGLIGPLELPRLWTRHILNSVIAAPLLRPGRVGDVGSGAGLPGIVLAIARPDVQFVLIEPMERRVAWLNEQVEALGLQNVEVIRARAEDAKHIAPLDQVTARAVSALRTLIPLTAPLARRGGELVLFKGINAQAEIGAAEKQIRRFKLSNVRVDVLGEGVLDETTRAVRATVGSDERTSGSVSRETFG